MGQRRADLGFGDALEDLSSFAPTPKPKPEVDTAEAAAAAGFKSREPVPPKPAPSGGAGEAPPRRRRTGRNAQFNIKARPETIEAFYKVADANGWGLGETLEHAVALLEKEHL